MNPAQTKIPTPWTAHYDPWFKPHLDYPDLTLYELFLKAANRFPDYPALTYFGRSFSYLAVHEKVEEAAEALTVLGFKPGQVATICLPNVAPGCRDFLCDQPSGWNLQHGPPPLAAGGIAALPAHRRIRLSDHSRRLAAQASQHAVPGGPAQSHCLLGSR